MKYLAWICLWLLLASGSARAQERFDVFYLAVGSSYYVRSPTPAQHGFFPLPGANDSARLVADILMRGGAKSGISLVSDDSHFISKSDIESALDEVAARIKARRPAHPLLVVYLAGHGISEGVAWNHFSVPGNFVYGAPIEHLDIDALAQHSIHAGLLADHIDKFKVPYVLMLDSCYDGKSQSFASPVLSATAIQNLTDAAAALRFLNEFHTPNPVLFSSKPGTEVPVAPDPRNPTVAFLAPMARRLWLVVQGTAQNGKVLTLSQLVAQLTSPTLDTVTAPAVTHATKLAADGTVIWHAAGPVPAPDERTGTATTADPCCEADVADPVDPNTRVQKMQGSLMFSGPAGESISDGSKIVLGPGVAVDLVMHGRSSVEITFDGADNWELDLSAPNGAELKESAYEGAQRYSFEDAGHPGFALTGAGRACNAVASRFTITRLAWRSDGSIDELAAEFTQRCDDDAHPLSGTVHLGRS